MAYLGAGFSEPSRCRQAQVVVRYRESHFVPKQIRAAEVGQGSDTGPH